jgi:sec-independent protein translocase protein TatC
MIGWDKDGGPVKTFLAHLDDLRRLLLGCLVAWAVGMAVAAHEAPRIMKVLVLPLEKAGRSPADFLQTFEVMGGMNLAMTIAIWGGLLLALPIMVGLIGNFILPALTIRERRTVLAGGGLAVILFVMGASIAYFGMLTPALRVMLWFNEWMGIRVEFFRVTDYVRFVLIMMAAFGICFELPVVLLGLGRLGIITSDQLRRSRRVAVVVLLIVAMIVTPTTDPFSQLVLAVPLVLLYEACIWAIWLMERRRREEGLKGS